VPLSAVLNLCRKCKASPIPSGSLAEFLECRCWSCASWPCSAGSVPGGSAPTGGARHRRRS